MPGLPPSPPTTVAQTLQPQDTATTGGEEGHITGERRKMHEGKRGEIMRGGGDEGTEMRKKGGEAGRGKQKARRRRHTQREKERVIARGSFLHT